MFPATTTTLAAADATDPGRPAAVVGADVLCAAGLRMLARQNGWGLGLKRIADGRYVEVNAALAALFGRSESEVLGHTDAELLDAAMVTLLRAADQTALAQRSPLTSEHRFELRGERREFSVLRAPNPAASADETGLLCSVWQDLAPQRLRDLQLKAALQQLEQQQRANEMLRRDLADQTLRDQASGLNTRAHFDDQMRRELDLSTREHREFALVYMALDAFSERVLAHGPRAQERIFEAMGRLLRGNTRAMDASCRIDDRHFAVLLSGVGLATAHSRMEGLRRQCATQIVMLDGEELGFTVAMGVASFPHTAHGHDELIEACNTALAEAQRRGGNTVALATIRFEAG